MKCKIIDDFFALSLTNGVLAVKNIDIVDKNGCKLSTLLNDAIMNHDSKRVTEYMLDVICHPQFYGVIERS